MRKGRQSAQAAFAAQARPPPPASRSDTKPSDAAIFLRSLQDPEVIERVRASIQNAHVFKLPPRQSASVGWRGADWKEKVWQGTVKVVERGELTAVLLIEKNGGSIFAVCPVKDGAVDRCVDSSRYFVLRIENADGRHMFIGVAFNERNDSFDFYTALEDSRREREMEKNPIKLDYGPPKDYSIKEGEKIKVSIPRTSGSNKEKKQGGSSGTKSFLRPSSRDTPSRGGPADHQATQTKSSFEEIPPKSDFKAFSGGSGNDPFSSESFEGENFFEGVEDKGNDPFFQPNQFDPRNFNAESGR
mmetsp:Transcript_25143/g.42836  ORF Transcript_25143/g.42836 Transcript_25143/m.42836 type:complete len:301 (-) Transcript_25143:207-1109(-)|eukprot:CAMPEP_0116564612 /NCGR_PEP_ID=MMETSP0397-20121206/13402_1 /TAXON_ID=216820 /ORGANISM="Cyclophora tenuis, Strain ECT3854" /LENGTH=300 /DNA_ID=CAMNT_0004091219 /DNA_START=75 /DNA_END=977 /DNA_ORIENTATION=-